MSDVLRRRSRTRSRTRSLQPPRRAWVVMAIGVAASLALFTWQRERERKAQRNEFERHASLLANQVQRGFELPLEAVRALPDFLAASERVTREEFRTFARPILERHPNVSYIEWAPYVPDAQRAAFEQRARQSEWPDFQIVEPGPNATIVRSPQRAYYMPLVHAASLIDQRPLIGLDVGFDQPRRARNEHALLGDSVDISPRFVLVEDPPEVGSIAILIPASGQPVSDDPLVPRRGIAILIFRLEATIAATLPRGALDDVRLRVIDESAQRPDERVLFDSQPTVPAPSPAQTHVERFDYHSRAWSIHIAPVGVVPSPSAYAWTLLALGIAVSLGGGLTLTLIRAVGALHDEAMIARQLGQYRLVRKLGEGGMGTVYEAEHALLRRPTAVKVLSKRVLEAEGFERFEREVNLTSQLTHPNTVSIYDFGRTADGVFYYVMEHIAGVTIEALVRQSGPLPPARAVHLLRQIAGSLREAHAAGMVHRDIKPSNIMVCERGGIADFVKVLDFGLVKQAVGASDLKLSDAERLLGTPQYMAPEALLRRGPVTPSVDIYALGCVAYYMLTGTEVFRADTLASIVAHHIHEAPEPPSQRLGHTLPVALDACVLRCLAKQPDERFASMDAVIDALDAIRLPSTWHAHDATAAWVAMRAQWNAATVPPPPDPSGKSLSIDLHTRDVPR